MNRAPSFTLRLALVLVAALAATVVVAPAAAWLLALAGFHFPFPRIFDRVVMVAVAAAVLLNASRLKVAELLRAGFAAPASNVGRWGRGVVVAAAVLAVLWMVAAASGAAREPKWLVILEGFPRWMLSAVVIALIEEGFCRAFLLGGMQRDFRRTTALIASSAIYSAAHLFRAPEKYYVATFEPAVGLRNLIASTGQLSDPGAAIPAFVGLFILGLVLGRAFLLTGTVYFSMGLHGGLVFGLKVWMQCVRRRLLPSWIIGASLAPVISSVSGWALALGVLVLLPRICRDRSEQVSEGTTRARGAAG